MNNVVSTPYQLAPGPEQGLPIRIYYEDTDLGGVVYHANYVKYFERARTEWLRSLGVELDTLRQREGLLFVVGRMNIEFSKSARFNQLLMARVDEIKLGGASMTLQQSISEQNDVYCSAEVQIVGIDDQTFRPKRMSDELREQLV